MDFHEPSFVAFQNYVGFSTGAITGRSKAATPASPCTVESAIPYVRPDHSKSTLKHGNSCFNICHNLTVDLSQNAHQF